MVGDRLNLNMDFDGLRSSWGDEKRSGKQVTCNV